MIKSSIMRITAGAKNPKEAVYYMENGADEIYFGLGRIRNNRLEKENFGSLKEITELLKEAGKRRKKAFMAVNEIVDEKDFPAILSLFSRLKERGLAGAIVRDPALLDYFKKKKFRFYFTLSTLANSFNLESLKFFAGLGVSRLVLPMQMTPENAGGILRNRWGVETEVFCQPLYWGVNLDSKCTLPCPQTGLARALKFNDYPCLFDFKKKDGGIFNMPMPGPEYLLSGFYDYYHGGADYVKVARWSNSARQADLFFKVRYLLKLLKKGIGRNAFVSAGLRLNSKPLEYGQTFTFKPL